jgi:hypothetical protein
MKNANNDNDSWTSLGFQTLLVLNRFKTTATLSEHARETENPNQQEHPTGDPANEHRNEGPRRAIA